MLHKAGKGPEYVHFTLYATEQYNRMEKLVEWLDRGLISHDQFQAMSAEVTATVPKPA